MNDGEEPVRFPMRRDDWTEQRAAWRMLIERIRSHLEKPEADARSFEHADTTVVPRVDYPDPLG